jgi:hypothetical protein
METGNLQETNRVVHINIYDNNELDYWLNTFDVSEEALLRAVEKSGTLAKEVERTFRRNKKGCEVSGTIN